MMRTAGLPCAFGRGIVGGQSDHARVFYRILDVRDVAKSNRSAIVVRDDQRAVLARGLDLIITGDRPGVDGVSDVALGTIRVRMRPTLFAPWPGRFQVC